MPMRLLKQKLGLKNDVGVEMGPAKKMLYKRGSSDYIKTPDP